MHDPAPLIFIVDDDESMRRAMSRLIKTWGYEVAEFADAECFLEAPCAQQASCVILDLRLPNLNGLKLQAEMARRGRALPIIFLTGHGDVPTSVAAMRGGAVDFLEKPVEEMVLQSAVRRALEISIASMRVERELERTRRHLADLTPREFETMRWVMSGTPNKVIAHHLGITERTVKAHRSQVMKKIRVRSVAELVRHVEPLGVEPKAG
jgi:FixJ family two-component response regulator